MPRLTFSPTCPSSLAERIAEAVYVLLLVGLLTFLFWPKDSHADTLKEGVAQSLLLMDWAQTRDIVHHQSECDYSHGVPLVDITKKCDGGYVETNPLIGSHPSMGRVNTYFASVMLGHYLIDRNLSPVNQDRFEWATIALEAVVVLHNRKIGLSVRF